METFILVTVIGSFLRHQIQNIYFTVGKISIRITFHITEYTRTNIASNQLFFIKVFMKNLEYKLNQINH